jgi:hypothetical protein
MMSTMSAPIPLPPEFVHALVGSSCACVAAPSSDGYPSIAPVLACLPSEDGLRVELYLAAQTAGRALADMVAGGIVSVRCQGLEGGRDLFIMGRDAMVIACTPQAEQAVARRNEAFVAEQLVQGHPSSYSQALTAYDNGTLVAVAFTPDEWRLAESGLST